MSTPPKNIILSELRELAPEVSIQGASQATLEALLFTLGIDIKLGFERLTGMFRDSQMPSKVINEVYWQGTERSDKPWRESGLASDEVVDSFRGSINKSNRAATTGSQWAGVERAAKELST